MTADPAWAKTPGDEESFNKQIWLDFLDLERSAVPRAGLAVFGRLRTKVGGRVWKGCVAG